MIRRTERIGAAAVARQSRAVAERIAEAAPGVRASVTPDGVMIEGVKLRRDARLRWIAGLMR